MGFFAVDFSVLVFSTQKNSRSGLNLTAKKHHYIPQFYLKRFADPLASQGRGKPVLWVYEKGKPIRSATPENEAHQNYFYAFGGKTGKQRSVEEVLAEIESEIAPLFERLDDPSYFFPADVKGRLAFFLALMFFRVPTGRSCIDELTERALAQDEDQFKKDCEVILGKTESSGSIEQLRQAFLSEQSQPKPSRGLNLERMFQAAEQLTPYLHALPWQILCTDGHAAFLTSDNPIFTVLPCEPGKAGLGAGFGRPGVEIYFPLGSKHCLRITSNQRAGRVPLEGRRVRLINKTLMMFARRFLYASEKSSKIEDLFTRIGCQIVYGKNAFLPEPSTVV